MKTYHFPRQLDHLVYTTADLASGMDRIEQLLGVRPVLGGRHPQYGTHNALVSLGDQIYLEIVAPDPAHPAPERGRWLANQFAEAPHLSTWVLRTNDLQDLVEEAQESGIQLGAVSAGSRQTPDGTLLKWQLTDPYALPLEGAIPFLIHWGDTPHPATGLPADCQLIDLRIEHPLPELVQEQLAALQVRMTIKAAQRMRLMARIRTPRGEVELF